MFSLVLSGLKALGSPTYTVRYQTPLSPGPEMTGRSCYPNGQDLGSRWVWVKHLKVKKFLL